MTTATGRYATLTNGVEYLDGLTALDSNRASFALAEGDLFVERRLIAFDLSGFTAANTPREVAAIARRIASATYIRAELAAAAPEGDDKLAFCKRLEREAGEIADEIRGRGYIVSDAGPIYTREGGPSAAADFPVLRR